MKNPPDFVMYVVMVKLRDGERFDPYWYSRPESTCVTLADGFARKRDADKECKIYRERYGKKNAYVQQYGPYS